MEPTTQVPIGAVEHARRLGVRSQAGALRVYGERTSVQVKMEVYTGWVDPNLPVQFLPGTIRRRQARTFLPIDDQGHIREYQENSLVDYTVTVSPAVIRLDDDEATLFAVDGAPSVALKSQAFPGIGGTPFHLVLTVDLARLNIDFRKFTYQVTVLTREWTRESVLSLGDREMPKPVS
jgi:hypothetical protein